MPFRRVVHLLGGLFFWSCMFVCYEQGRFRLKLANRSQFHPSLKCVSQLCRQEASLARDSSRDEDALNAYLFELVKAGRISEAAKACVDCGQPWRAASLLGGGPNGTIPLGGRPASANRVSGG